MSGRPPEPTPILVPPGPAGLLAPPTLTGAATQAESGAPSPPRRRSVLARAISYLRAHPILVLLLLSPGIPEYLSGSSPLNEIVLDPPGFLLQLALNLGLYGPGVLLAREASVRWEKDSMIPVLLLGAAYGILEEGIALSTLFSPTASVVHSLGYYGHFDGVNTVWTAGILMVHMVYSIGLPIFLVSEALPETRGRSFLSDRGIGWCLGILGTVVTILLIAVVAGGHYWMGWPLFAGSLAVIAALLVVAHAWPSAPAVPGSSAARGGLWAPGLVGAVLFPAILIVEGLGQDWAAPAAGVIAVVVALQLAVGLYAYRFLRGIGNERRRLAFVAGLLLPILTIGLVAQFPIEIVIVADVALAVWLSRLMRRASPRPVGGGTVPPSSTGIG
jgi:hypothetical protein